MDRPSTPPTNPDQVIAAVRDLTEKLKQANEKRRRRVIPPPRNTPPFGIPVARPSAH
mgnify:CR=1